MTDSPDPALLPRALALASQIHAGQKWRDKTKPYLFHPLAVASLVLAHGGDEEQAAAALLHDTISDPRANQAALSEAFTPEVARLAHAFADPPGLAADADWAVVRSAYHEKLRGLSPRELFVIGCEELHELSELVDDLRALPVSEVWGRYPTPRQNLGWYFREILAILHTKLPEPTGLKRAYAARLNTLLEIAFEGK